MSSVQAHPAVQQAQEKAGYYLNQLDKEVGNPCSQNDHVYE